jgi:hypothetical protein
LLHRKWTNARFVKQVEEREIRSHIESNSMIGNPAIDSYAYGGHARLAKKDPGDIGPHGATQAEFRKHSDNRPVQ